MKSVFKANSVRFTNLDEDSLVIVRGLISDGFSYVENPLDSLGGYSLEYPLYTNATEAKEIYRKVQKDLALIK